MKNLNDLYKSGESHYYLGRRYPLKIIDGHSEAVHYKGRYLQIETKDKAPQHVKKLLDKWYRERADKVRRICRTLNSAI